MMPFGGPAGWGGGATSSMMGRAPVMVPSPMMGWLPSPMSQADAENMQIPGFRPGMDKPVTIASLPLHKLPGSPLTEAVEFVEPKMDVTSTVQMDAFTLTVILWELTRLKPTIKVSELRSNTYVELWLRLRAAAERHKNVHEAEVKAYVKGALSTDDLKEYALDHAVQHGLDPEWLNEKKDKKQSHKIDDPTDAR